MDAPNAQVPLELHRWQGPRNQHRHAHIRSIPPQTQLDRSPGILGLRRSPQRSRVPLHAGAKGNPRRTTHPIRDLVLHRPAFDLRRNSATCRTHRRPLPQNPTTFAPAVQAARSPQLVRPPLSKLRATTEGRSRSESHAAPPTAGQTSFPRALYHRIPHLATTIPGPRNVNARSRPRSTSTTPNLRIQPSAPQHPRPASPDDTSPPTRALRAEAPRPEHPQPHGAPVRQPNISPSTRPTSFLRPAHCVPAATATAAAAASPSSAINSASAAACADVPAGAAADICGRGAVRALFECVGNIGFGGCG